MKSRIVFLCTLAAFLNPIASMALETKVGSSTDIACKEWAKGKVLAADRNATASAPASSGSVKKSGDAS